MTTFYAQSSTDLSTVIWNDQAGGGGSNGTPGNGDTCDLNNKTLVMDITTFPTSGTLTAIQDTHATGTGCITLAMSGSTTYHINATNINAAKNFTGMIQTSGAAPSATLALSGNVTGGSAGYGVHHYSTGSLTCLAVAGGSGGYAGITIDTGNVTCTSVTGGSNSSMGILIITSCIINCTSVTGNGGVGIQYGIV